MRVGEVDAISIARAKAAYDEIVAALRSPERKRLAAQLHILSAVLHEIAQAVPVEEESTEDADFDEQAENTRQSRRKKAD